MYRSTSSAPRHPLAELFLLATLSLAVLLIHGYHPWAEDGGLYVAGVEYLLRPGLFPRDTAFVTEHLQFSVFAPAVAALVRVTHVSLAGVLFSIYLISIALTLFAALRIAQGCFRERTAQWTAVALLAAWWTLPVAGTSLLLMDPYVTARSLSTPLSLLALGAALRPWSRRGHNGLHVRVLVEPALCIVSLLLAAALHPLMAAYAIALVVVLRLGFTPPGRGIFLLLTAALLSVLAVWQLRSPGESPAVVAACFSRYYWFLSRWQWYEWLGLLGPVLIFAAVLRWPSRSYPRPVRALCIASLQTAAVSVLIASLFAQEHFAAHPVGRLQPLRAFLLLYVIMILMVGGLFGSFILRLRSRLQTSSLRLLATATLPLCLVAAVLPMWLTQRASFPASPPVEWPGHPNPNPWVQAFLWIRQNTPEDAFFALDSRYINRGGEDAQTFRALALRSAVPDFSKDGGEAAITPALAPAWLTGSNATKDLSRSSDLQRWQSLMPLGVQWLVLDASAPTNLRCPYRNPVVKVCALAQEAAWAPMRSNFKAQPRMPLRSSSLSLR